MNKIQLKELQIETTNLKELLTFYAKADQLAVDCLNELEKIFDEILLGDVNKVYDQIPCSRYFIDDTLGGYQDLSESYSKFANLAEGVDRDKLDDFFKTL